MRISVYMPEDKMAVFYCAAVDEYAKRLGAYCKCRLIQVKNVERLSDKLLSEAAYVISVNVRGVRLDSPSLADTIRRLGITGRSTLALIIGIDGIASDLEMSITQMDMDTGLQTVIVYEQIYRAYRIINNQPYHK